MKWSVFCWPRRSGERSLDQSERRKRESLGGEMKAATDWESDRSWSSVGGRGK